MARKVFDNISIENAHLMFRNFSGAASQYNREGDRSFCVRIDDLQAAKKLAEDGWNIKQSKPHDPEEEPTFYIKVKVSFNPYPPAIWWITRNNKVIVGEDMVDSLDQIEIKTADVIIRPYNWEVNGKTGVAAYLKSLYIVQEEDEFAYKYEDLHPEE